MKRWPLRVRKLVACDSTAQGIPAALQPAQGVSTVFASLVFVSVVATKLAPTRIVAMA
jgi:hypothetical protein